MRPKVPTFDRSLPAPVLKASRTSGDPCSRASCAPGVAARDSGKSFILSTGQNVSKRLACQAHNNFIVCAVGSKTSVATRLVIPDLKLQFGERVKCVGQSSELGSWQLEDGPLLAWTEGDNWVHHLQLPTGHHEFKLLIARDNGSTHWEQGANRTIEVPERIDGIFEVKCRFEDTSDTKTATIPYPDKKQNKQSGKSNNRQQSYGWAKPSENGSSSRRNFFAQGDLPDAMEGDSTESEPDTLKEAKKTPQRFSWEKDDRDAKRDDKGNKEAMEGVSPPSSDPCKETEPSTDDRRVVNRVNGYSSAKLTGPEVIVSPHKNSTWSASGHASLNGTPHERVDLTRPELSDITKDVFKARGKPVRMYGGAEARELDDGTVLVKFPSDDKGEDILTLVERLLGYNER